MLLRYLFMCESFEFSAVVASRLLFGLRTALAGCTAVVFLFSPLTLAESKHGFSFKQRRNSRKPSFCQELNIIFEIAIELSVGRNPLYASILSCNSAVCFPLAYKAQQGFIRSHDLLHLFIMDSYFGTFPLSCGHLSR